MKLLISILVAVSLVFSEPIQFTHPGQGVKHLNGCGTLTTLILEDEAIATGFSGEILIEVNGYPAEAEIYENGPDAATNENEFCIATKDNDKNIIHLVGNTIFYNFKDKISQISFNVEGGKVIGPTEYTGTVLAGYKSTLITDLNVKESKESASKASALNNISAIAKWLHIIAGVMWIGLLYFFNFINGHVAGTMDADSKKKVVPELMPRTLYWFRWGAAWTWLTGIILLYVIFWNGSLSMGESPGNKMFEQGALVDMWAHIMLLVTFAAVFVYDFLYKSALAKNVRLITIISFLLIAGIEFAMIKFGNYSYRAFNIHIGAMFGTMMAFNVWFRIWPAQQKIITAIKNGEAPDGNLVALAGLRSKHNTYMSVPLLWTMINEHTVGFSGSLFNISGLVLLLIIALGWHIVFQFYKKSAKIKGF